MKPIIGINLDFVGGEPDQVALNTTYIQAIQQAGGIALPLVPMPEEDLKEILDKLDGLLFIGGKDYHPDAYCEEPRAKLTVVHPTRQEFDITLSRTALNQTRLPVLGICAGHQLINIGLGGNLIQDIEPYVKSSLFGITVDHGASVEGQCSMVTHKVGIIPGTELAKIYGTTEIEAPSSHHQAIDRLGRGLVVSARSADGIIEAVESPDRPFTIGVQFHPERANNPALFEALIKAAARYHAERAGSELPLYAPAGLLANA